MTLLPEPRSDQTLYPYAETPPAEPFPTTVPPEFLKGLSHREMQFLSEFIDHGNPRRAMRATLGDEAKMMSPGDVSRRVMDIMKRPRMKAAMAKVQAFLAYHTGLHVWQILGMLHTHAFFDANEIYDKDGSSWDVKPMGEWSLEARQSVQKIRVQRWNTVNGKGEETQREQIDVEFADRQHAIFLLGKHLKLWEKRERQVAPFTLVLNTQAPEAQVKQVGEVIEGIGLSIQIPEAPPG